MPAPRARHPGRSGAARRPVTLWGVGRAECPIQPPFPGPMLQEPPTGARWERLLSASDASLIDAGAAGERTVARARLVFTAILLLIPLQSIVQRSDQLENYVGLVVGLVSLGFAASVLAAVSRGHYRTWWSIATSVYDVTSVSAILAAFILIGRPEITVNSRVVFEIYLLAIASTALRYDRRAPLVAGAVAVVEYAALVLVVHAHWDLSDPRYAGYGNFSWGDQIGRLIVLGVAAMLSRAVLERAHRLRQLSTHDPLTRLFNRNVLEERVREEVGRARRYGRPLALAMVDLDLFKQFNDTFGHASGDAALRAFAHLLRRTVRSTDIVARFGGEEFVIVLPETPGDDAAVKLDQIRRLMETMLFDIPGVVDGHVTFSAGVATLDRESDHALDLLQRADDLLLAAKRAGRNCVMGESGLVGAPRSDAAPARVDGTGGRS